MIFGGGIPIVAGREVIGAAGVSGASVEEDVACATAAVETAHTRLGLPLSPPLSREG